MKILLCGAGIAGATLAWWLLRDKHEVTIVEKAQQFRTGGYVVDFWGAGYEIIERMGLEAEVERCGYRVQALRTVNDRGQEVNSVPVEIFRQVLHNRFVSISRSDLAAIIWDAVAPRVETVFADTVVALHQAADGVHVTFEHSADRTFDMVVGTDGLHSRVRELVFGPQSRFERYLGIKVAAFEAEGYRPRDELAYVLHTRVGGQIGRFSLRNDRTLFLVTFADAVPELPATGDLAGQRECIAAHFQADRWDEMPSIMAALEKTDHLYLDRVSQIRMPRWTEGKVTLVGDAAACPSLLAGEGSGLAIVAAYVLATELRRSSADVGQATTAYEARCGPFVLAKQDAALGFASYFAPRSQGVLWLQQVVMKLMRIPWLATRVVARSFADRIDLSD